MPVRTKRIDGPLLGQGRHDPVARAGAEASTDVHADAGSGDDQPGDEQRPLLSGARRVGEVRQDDVHRGADEDGVEDGAEPESLAQRDPAPAPPRTTTSTLTVPMGMPVRSDTPWWSTSHGSRPRSAWTMQANAIAAQDQPEDQGEQPTPDLWPRGNGEQARHGFDANGAPVGCPSQISPSDPLRRLRACSLRRVALRAAGSVRRRARRASPR